MLCWWWYVGLGFWFRWCSGGWVVVCLGVVSVVVGNFVVVVGVLCCLLWLILYVFSGVSCWVVVWWC